MEGVGWGDRVIDILAGTKCKVTLAGRTTFCHIYLLSAHIQYSLCLICNLWTSLGEGTTVSSNYHIRVKPYESSGSLPPELILVSIALID